MVQERIKAVLAQVFQVDPADVPHAASPEDIDGWDSFGHLALVEALQTEFSLRFELEDIAQMENLEAIAQIVQKRRGQVS
jgi:acyl carrier protein